MLIGEYQHSLDDKGRVNFPAKLRDGLGSRFIIAKGPDTCLCVYSEDEWLSLGDKIRARPPAEARTLERFLFASAADAVPDKQGRVVIPSNLREYAGLDKEVVIIGASIRAEIWDKNRWLSKCEEFTPDMMSEAMDNLGF